MSQDKGSDLVEGLGLREALAIVVGRIIGSGIFRTPGPMMLAVAGLDAGQNYAPGSLSPQQMSVGLFLLAWVIGGVATILASLCYAELVAMLPRSGGPYAYLKEAYSDLWAFLRGWAMFFVSETASIVAVALVFSEYGAYALKTATGIEAGTWGEAGVALAIILALTLANSFGVFASGILQDVLSFLKVFALIVLVLTCFSARGDVAHFTSNVWPEQWGWGTMFGMAAALRYGFFAYSGWEGATYVAEEVRNPRKNLPLSLLLGVCGVMCIYLLVNGAYLYQLDAVSIALARKEISARAMEAAIGTAGGLFIAGAVMLSTFGNVSTQIMVKARTWHAMARDGLFFSVAAKTSPRFRTPNRALWLQALWASILLIAATLAGGKYERIIDFFTFTSYIFNLSTILAVWVLRVRKPGLERPFRIPFFYITVPLTLAIYGWFTLATLIDRPLESMLGVLLTLLGLLFYFWKKRQTGIKAEPV
ncbi:MAG: amino acid permease [Spirochaetales bacterium]|nr:amino acid permease [Leptospiraceae bacterium]MCP5482180.1 amino acid permease [Spirochaetales bacterium]MCP5484708.1 amino acid permease [Spirochaetales bacterium]